MKVKLLQLRDSMTFIPLLCIDLNPDFPSLDANRGVYEAQRWLLRRVGYRCDGSPTIAITALRADGDRFWSDPFAWKDRTYSTAHQYIQENWEHLSDGEVVDVEHILGETQVKKTSEELL